MRHFRDFQKFQTKKVCVLCYFSSSTNNSLIIPLQKKSKVKKA